MLLQIYVYDAADVDEPLLLAEVSDLEEAVALCHEFVEDDGHARAEAWDEDGDCRYGVALRAGAVRTYGLPQEPERLRAHVPPPAGPRRRSPSEVAAVHPAVHPAADASPSPDRPRDGPPAPHDRLLGDLSARPEQWFGV